MQHATLIVFFNTKRFCPPSESNHKRKNEFRQTETFLPFYS